MIVTCSWMVKANICKMAVQVQGKGSSSPGLPDEKEDTGQNIRMIFTGPDYIRDHRVTVETEHRQVGIGTMSKEGTSEVDYLWRAAPGTPFPFPKPRKVGEIGWGLEHFSDWSVPVTGRQVMMGEFRQELEDRYSHKYQTPWYPGPKDEFDPESDEGRVMRVYRSRRTQKPQAD